VSATHMLGYGSDPDQGLHSSGFETHTGSDRLPGTESGLLTRMHTEAVPSDRPVFRV